MTYDLSLIVPVYNESGNIEELITRINKTMRQAGLRYQLIFVDDRSQDDTVIEIKKHGKDLPIVIHVKKGQKGKAFSILEGSKLAESDWICMIDGDLQYPPEVIPEMLDLARKNGVAVANRKTAKTSLLRKLGSRLNSHLFAKTLLNLNCDAQSGLKVFKREIIDQLETKGVTKWTLDMPLLFTALELGYQIKSLDIIFKERVNGESKINFLRASSEIAVQAIKLRFRKRKIYQIKPSDSISMQGAGVVHKRKRYVTHTTLKHNESALIVLSSWQKTALILALCGFSISLFFNFYITLLVAIGTLSFLYFADTLFSLFVLLKSLHFPPELNIAENEVKELNDKTLPVYTVLCPLYKEERVLPHFVESVEKLDWPKNKLEIILLLEEDDKATIKAANKMNLPSNFKIAVVPHSYPKTKPKACNYGLNIAKGEYIVIYDAEDRPDPLQLKKAYLGFKRAGKDTFCLQCKLNYFNPKQNLLTRLFTAEYSLWFDLTLPGLQSIETTIPLGGTSNHFRRADLLKLEGWDPFNVTEDCDLGVRLFKKGYKTAIVDSVTLEEANSNIKNWIRQRSRWIKGYFQTYLVHMRRPIKNFKEEKIHALIFQLVIGMRMTFILINPFLWIATLSYFLLYKFVGPTIEALYPAPVFYMAVFSLIFGNFMYLYNYMIGLAKREHWELIKYVFFVPFYWIMTSIAAYVAIYQLIFKPHYWEKTHHGLNLKDAIKNPEKLTQKEKKRGFTYIKTFAKSGVISGGFLVFASIVGNFFNFLYNAYLGRVTTAQDFGTIGLIGSLLYISQIPTSGIGRTVTYKSAQLFGKHETPIKSYWRRIRKHVVLIALFISLIWLLLIPLMMTLFHSSTPIPFLLFLPVWFFGFVGSVDGGFLSGNLFFVIIGITAITEAATKFMVAFILITLKRPDLVYAALPISMSTTFLISYISILLIRTKEKNIVNLSKSNEKLFPKKFFTTSILAKIASISFLSLDVILAKVFLGPVEAGQYALLSLTGSMVFFFGTLFSQFITPLISKEEGAGRDSEKLFIKLLLATTGASLLSFLLIGVLGPITVPIMLGAKTYAILPYIIRYGLAMVFFTIVVNIVSYHQIRGRYIFTILSFLLAGLQIFITCIFHTNIDVFTNIMFCLGALNLTVFLYLHKNYNSVKAAFGNIADFLGIFSYEEERVNSKLKILIFNWRDTKHIWSGGAEVYIHELAKRWVKEGNRVTLFCGNDGKSSRHEIIDGVNVIRRGGFYTVYIWAFLYYVLRLRKRYDVIIDSENGIPFFTPLYTTKPKFLLIHHVHQDVFQINLKPPLAWIGAFLEKKLMPFVYKNAEVVTVSPSSKADIIGNKLTRKDPFVIYNGVDQKYKPGIKSKSPLVLYIGRIRTHKSLHIFVYAAKKVLEILPDIQFIIAGEGQQSGLIKKLINDLGLDKKVLFLGKVSEEKKLNLYQKAWVFVNPSLMEGWGITTIEANACGVPVIASNVPGLRDAVHNPHSGLLVPYGNVDEFAQSIEYLVRNTKIRKGMSEEAVEWSKNYTWDKSAKEFLDLITGKGKNE